MASREQLEQAINNPNVRKFLDLIAHTEGTEGNGYRTAFGGGRLPSLNDHPRYLKSFKQKNGETNKTSAAGRYQFLRPTWDKLARKYGLSDFGARNQDLGAVALLAQSGALQHVLNGDWRTGVQKAGPIWASLPSAPKEYSQPTRSWQNVSEFMGGQGGAMSTQSMTNAQKIKIYQAYKGGKMSAFEKAQYEADVNAGVVQMPKGGKLLTTSSKPKTSASGAQELPLSVALAYNNGEMDDMSVAQLDADIKSGIVRAPKGIKLQKPKPKGLVGRSADKLGAAGDKIIDNQLDDGGVSNVVGAADAAVGVAGGMADLAMTGWSGLGGMAGAAMRGQPVIDGFGKGVSNYEQTGVSEGLKSLATPRTQTGGALMDVLGIADDAIVSAGDAAYEATDSPAVGAGVQTALSGLGFLVPLRAKRKGAAASESTTTRPKLTPEEVRARVREADNRRADGSRIGLTEAPPVPRQITPLEAYQNAMSRSTGDLSAMASNLDNINAQGAQNAARINNIDTTPRPDYSNAQASPAPEVVISEAAPRQPVTAASIEPLLDLDASKPSVSGAPVNIQGLRAEVLKSLGIPDESVRKGAITNNITQLEREKALSKMDNDAGIDMRDKLDSEYRAMNSYANDIIEVDIGARPNASPESRGQVVIDALQNYKDWYKEQVRADYAKADEITGGVGGILLDEFAGDLSKNSNWQGKKSNQQLRRGINSYLNEMQLIGDKGSIRPMTAKQAEGLRQYINSQWSPDSAGLIGRINESIDMGVFRTLDDNGYLTARNRYRQYKEMFENPKGIGKLLDMDGINRKVSPEMVGRNMQLLAAKDGAQFRHIYNLLENVPDTIKSQAARAKSEIQAMIAESVLGKAGLKSISKEWAQYRKRGDDGNYKAAAIFGDDVATKIDTYVAGRNILQHQDPNPSGTATTAANLETWNSPENIAGATVGMTGGLLSGGNAAIAVGAGLAGKVVHRKIRDALSNRQSRAEFDDSVNPQRAETYRAANDQLINDVINTSEMQTLIDEFEKTTPNQTKMQVLQRKLAKTKEWRDYVKTLPPKARQAAAKNADILMLITQGANSQDNDALKTTF